MTVVYINYMYLENNRVGDEYYPTVASIFIVNMLLITSIGYMISRNVKNGTYYTLYPVIHWFTQVQAINESC